MLLSLGSAQFGLDYGITNKEGKVKEENIKKIIEIASKNNISMIDTANSYGSAEEVLGRLLPKDRYFKISTKLNSQISESFSKNDIKKWEKSLLKSLKIIGKNSFDSFLIHNPYDLKKIGSEYLIDWLIGIKERGLVKRLGVSIYEAKDLLDVPNEILNLVQLPLSIYDQRLINDGTIKNLKKQGIAIHARSIFLQGLVLLSADKWPNWIKKSSIIKQKLLEEIAKKRSCELIDLAIGFAKFQKDLEAIVIGVCNEQQLNNLLKAWKNKNPWILSKKEWQNWSSNDKELIDPRIWNINKNNK